MIDTKRNLINFIAALRGGEFDQCAGQLRTTDIDGNHAYCCLGVGTYLAIEAGVISEKGWDVSDADAHTTVWDVHGVLPVAVALWLGVDLNPIIGTDNVGDRLEATRANDVLHQTFDQIADAFEATYLTPTSVEVTT